MVPRAPRRFGCGWRRPWLGQTPETQPEAAAAYERQGILLREQFRLDESEAALRRAIRIDPARIDARRVLVAILGLERRGLEQELELWELLARTPRPVEALRVLAQAGPAIPPDGLPPGLDEGQALAKVLEVEPENARARAALSAYYRGRGNSAEALRILNGNRAKAPELQLEMWALELDEGDLAQQLQWIFDKPVTSAEWGGDPRFAKLQGDFFQAQKDPTKAVEAYRRGLPLDPRGLELRYRLGQALLALGDRDEADACFAYARDTLVLKALVAKLNDEDPDRTLCAQATALCEKMGRSREAEAWRSFAKSRKEIP